MKINWFVSGKYFFTDESVKRQITDSISENSTDSDLESRNRNISGVKNFLVLLIAILWILKVTVNYMQEEIKIVSLLKIVISVVVYFIHCVSTTYELQAYI